MSTPQRFRIKFAAREGPAGARYLELESARESCLEALGCESVHLHFRDGIADARIEALVRDLNAAIEEIAIRRS